MKPGLSQKLAGALLVAASIGIGAPAFANKFDEAAGKVIAADIIGKACKGLRGIGDGSSKGFVESSLAILVGDGMRRNPLAMRLYYATTESLHAIAFHEIETRGVDPKDENALCRFGKSVVGTNDAIGRFLVKGD
jgi:hypothetical protein